MGGDEFALLLHDACEDDARALADLVADVVQAQRFGFDPRSSVSASVGVATFGAGRETTPTALPAEADSAMYEAKGERPKGYAGGRRRTDDPAPEGAAGQLPGPGAAPPGPAGAARPA